MNKFQNKFTFKFLPTSSKGRYISFYKKRFDLIMFEDKKWDWDNNNILASKILLESKEVYITKAGPSKDQSFFYNIQDKSIAVIRGYHYKFANFNSDENYLKKNFKIQISSSHSGNILKALLGRTDIAVVSLSYLNKFLKDNPDKKDLLLVSEKFDQEYKHRILIRKKINITVEDINNLINKMEKAGIINRIWKKYGIK